MRNQEPIGPNPKGEKRKYGQILKPNATVTKATDPGVRVAQANKAKQDSILSVYKKESQAKKATGVRVAQANKAKTKPTIKERFIALKKGM